MNQLRRSVAAGLGTAAILALMARHVRLNTSASVPRGLYWLSKDRPTRADLILFCPPSLAATLAAARHYLPSGLCPGDVEPMGKILLASAGDVVDLTASGLAINGRPLPSSQPRGTDSQGRPLAHYRFGTFTVARGELWVFSPHPRSFDSRYFGPVPGGLLMGTLSPLLTLRRAAVERTADAIRHSSRRRS
jgi:conjugative transfer signal peptidase TraF